MKTNLIIVDDDEMILECYSHSFRKEIRSGEYVIEMYQNGKECCEALNNMKEEERNNLIVIVSDINMPIMDGFELLKRVKEDFNHLHVMMVSAYNDPETVAKAESLGAKILVEKPIDFKELKNQIKRMKDIV